MNRGKLLLSIAIAASAIAGGVIAKWEGTRYKAYLDTGGIPTICTGHTRGVRLGDIATRDQCDQYLREDMAEATAIVNECVKVPLGKQARAAYLSFAFNTGRTQFCSSTLVRKLNRGDYAGACEELKRWVYDNGKLINGLVHRRADEYRLCTTIDFSLVYSGSTSVNR